MNCEGGYTMWPCFRGDSQEIYCEFKTLSGKGINIQGHTLTFSMKLDALDPMCHAYDLQHAMTVPFDDNAKIGRVKLEIAHEETRSLLPGRMYKYDFQLSNADCATHTEVITAGWGDKEVMRDVTNRVCTEPDTFPPCG